MSVQLGFKAEDIIAEGRVKKDDIKRINVWLREQENLPVISDEEIINFLLSNDNDQQKTKNTIKAFFSIRNEAPDIFNNRLMSQENSDAMEHSIAYFGIAPKRTKDNCAVILAQFFDTGFKNFSLVKFFKFLFMTLDAAIYSSPPNGLIIVIDMDGFGLMHLARLRPSAIMVFFRYLQEALPVKLINFHVVNTPYFMDKVMAIIKPLMNDHVTQLIKFHNREINWNNFYEKSVSQQLLPEDVGGDLPCMKDLTGELIESLKNMESYFIAEENQRSMESSQL